MLSTVSVSIRCMLCGARLIVLLSEEVCVLYMTLHTHCQNSPSLTTIKGMSCACSGITVNASCWVLDGTGQPYGKDLHRVAGRSISDNRTAAS